MNVAVIVPTLNPGSTWEHWVSALLATGKNVSDVYIIDSGSTDGVVVLSCTVGFNIKKIHPGIFNHGGTRQAAVADIAGYDVAVFLTQDAILCDCSTLESILKPFKDDGVAAVCGRQLARHAAKPIETHARVFNYSSQSYIRSIDDIEQCGLKTAFISNSFSAYRISALNEVGGFPDNVIFGEDMYVAAKLLLAGYKIAYASEACVYHSHDYSLKQEMQRYFDMGVFHAREPWLRKEFGGAEKEGFKFVFSELKYLARHAFWKIPEGLLRTALRYLGFRLGLFEKHLPVSIKRVLSMNKGYFKRS